MRLIDADALQEHFEKVKKESESLIDVTQMIGVQDVIDSQPTAYDVCKVLEEVGKRMFSAECYNEDFNGTQIDNLLCYGDVAEVICDGGVGEKK